MKGGEAEEMARACISCRTTRSFEEVVNRSFGSKKCEPTRPRLQAPPRHATLTGGRCGVGVAGWVMVLPALGGVTEVTGVTDPALVLGM